MSSYPDKKILIVEDELAIQKGLAKILGLEFGFIYANNGKVGLKQAIKHRPDLILLDIIMPVMSGWMMLKKLRQNEWGSKVPVIIITNLADDGKQRRLMKELDVAEVWRKAKLNPTKQLNAVRKILSSR